MKYVELTDGISDTNTIQITEYTECPKQPYDEYNHNYDIQDAFYFPVHRNVIVNKIQDYTCDYND